MADDLRTLTDDLHAYVSLRHRLGQSEFRFEDALLGHRRQCLQALVDDGSDSWGQRARMLDTLANAHGVPLSGEPTLRGALEQLAERERQRRAAEVQWRQRQRETG
jgi:hypothetical protein